MIFITNLIAERSNMALLITTCLLGEMCVTYLPLFKYDLIDPLIVVCRHHVYITDYLFLCSGSSLRNKQMFNLICELPETVARTLVPRMRVVKGSGKAINYLTPPRILLALVTAWVRRGRWFDDEVHRYTYFILLNIHLHLALIQ